MRKITKIAIFGLFVFYPLFASAEGSVKFYSAQGADAALAQRDGSYTLTLSGGAPAAGASTSADCYIKSNELKLEKGSLDGELAPVHNEIANLSARSVVGHRIAASVNNTTLDVKEAGVQGICADDIDLTGKYKIVTDGDGLRAKYAYYLSIVHSEAIIFLKSNSPGSAVDVLSPYVNSYREKWLRERNTRDILISSLNDYAYALQLVQRNDEAVSILRTVLSVAPNRAVAWLNIADSYWDMGDSQKARPAYKKYVDLMTRSGNAAKIPDRVNERNVN
ncbi:TPA: tetratricopeptide repeat protein [Burkholderia cepacia ATCC 25416]|uniref:tetratricopeptide repeat protein n=1 Tax=Burkholderia cepacia TaxID=292 RepID=UPI0009BE4CE9|nr:tetratricopeptide repeat protein [Burkholderia cepacia]HDR9766404.1 tetratricopeptide repeat protein [Burkholderia cepacia ATCC 25416]MCA8078941.1 tetratricopeptide repeat protein [Burkholderia cepacia]RRA17169.1 tetratricopeptide repeat protein [Burkholderia cepacia]HDR9779149.1 tetratricopeptide repeat protein [Burkholderia cepacia ATCC 25416]HDR9782768.1 tetratricopeptide repeat protein [Burkholderia cepacia ATCC 25416]